MESMRRNLRMQQCNFTSHGSSPRAARRVLSEPHEPVIPVSSLVKDCHEIPITVKVEHDNEDLVSYRALQEGGAYLREASVTDIGSLAKEEDNSIMQTEEKMIEVTVKQELDIGPMVLQPKSMPCQFSSPILDCYEIPVTMKLECDHEDFITYQEPHVVQARLREAAVADIGQLVKEKNDFIRKIEGETVEMTVKQELDIGPMVLQPNIMFCQRPAPTLPSLPDPSSSWTGDVSPALPYLVHPQPMREAHTEVGVYNSKRNSGALFDDCSVLDSERTVDTYQTALEKQSHDCIDSEDTSMDTEDGGQCRYSARSPAVDDIKYNTDAHTCSKPAIYCQYNTMKKYMDKNIETTLAHCKIKPCISEQFECGASQVANLKNPISISAGKSLSKCEYIASRPNSSKKQMLTHVGEKLHKCEHCDYSASRLSNLLNHIRTHTGEKPYKCEQCEYSACRLDSLKRHVRTHTGEKPYKCDRCEYETSRISNLKNHIRTHTGEKPYLCEHCEYSTSHFRSLQLHTRIHTGEKPYKCELCEYSASHITSIKRHMHTHTGEKPFKCESCKYGTTQMGNLKIHMRIHTGEKPYKCELCQYSASYVGSVKTHMRTHTGDKPYKCELCGYCASHVSTMKSHMRTHTGDKPYKCEHCEYSTSHINGLKSHMRIHTGEKPYVCDQCEYRATNVGNLKRHIRIHMIEKLNNMGSISTAFLN